MEVEIRDIKAEKDLRAINNLMQASWTDAYQDIFTDSELQNIRSKKYTDFKELEWFRKDPEIKAKMVLKNAQSAGFFVACSEEQSCYKNNCAEISLAYLNPDFQGEGIGSRTMDRIEEEIMRDWSSEKVRVEVFEENEEAKAFYQENGYSFEEFHHHKSGPGPWDEESRSYAVMEKFMD